MDPIIEFVKDHTPPFSLTKFIEFLPELGRGAVVTVEVTMLGFLVAAVLGLFVALARMSDRRWLSAPFTAYLELIRNTPFLVQLYVVFFVLPLFGLRLPSFLTGVLVLGVHFSSYLSEVYRSGIESVDRGQYEAAIALSMSRSLTMRRIVLPQAIRTVIPAMGNYFIGMFKESAFVSVLAVEEIIARSRYLASITFRNFEIYTGAALFYFIVSFPAARVVNTVERYLRRDLVETPVGAPPWYQRLFSTLNRQRQKLLPIGKEE